MSSAASSSVSVEIARRLVGRAAASANGGEPKIVGAALQKACDRVLGTLRDSLGEDGCNALIIRALTRTERRHPLLQSLRRLDESGVHLDGVAAGVETNSVAEVTAAIEALLGALVDVLGRLIGEDMAIRIIDPDSHSRNGDEARAS